MQTVKHKVFGIGEIVRKEVKDDRTYVMVKFPNKELQFVIPESFTIGVVEAQGSLKDEVDAAIAAARARACERARAVAAPARVSASSVRGGRKHPGPVAARGSIERAFEEYLAEAGYKLETDRGNPSTVFSYTNAVKSVLDEEGISWNTLKTKIADIVPLYDKGGSKERMGAKSNETVINALRRFYEFVNP